MSGSADGGARGPAWPDDREADIERIGQASIEHHFACSARGALRYSLVDGGIAYLCDECGARVVVGAEGEPTTSDGRAVLTGAEVEQARRELVGEGKPAGERSIAKRLGRSRDAVRYALGKDRS